MKLYWVHFPGTLLNLKLLWSQYETPHIGNFDWYYRTGCLSQCILIYGDFLDIQVIFALNDIFEKIPFLAVSYCLILQYIFYFL